jgi:hypothetical protein
MTKKGQTHPEAEEWTTALAETKQRRGECREVD